MASFLALALAACGGGDDAAVDAIPDADSDSGADLAAPAVDTAAPDVAEPKEVALACPPGQGFEVGQVLADLTFPLCDGGTMNLRDLCGAKVGWIRPYFGW